MEARQLAARFESIRRARAMRAPRARRGSPTWRSRTIPELLEFARKEAIAFTVVGPEAPLAEGVVDAFQAAGLRIFGPTQAAARLESSKEFAKAFMVAPRHSHRGLCSVHRCRSRARLRRAPRRSDRHQGRRPGRRQRRGGRHRRSREAHAAVDAHADRTESMGAAGSRVVIEQFLEGEEASFIVMCDGRHALPLASSQDHKRLLDGDHGPNTGGMGAYSPAPVVTPGVHARVLREVIQPVLAGMAQDGTPYTGFLYAGLMISRTAASRCWSSTAASATRKPSPSCCG